MFVKRILMTAAAVAVLAAAGGSAATAAPMNLSTGSAPWMLIPPSGSTTSASSITPNPNWTSITGAQWIGPVAGTEPAPTGIYTYALDFELARAGRDLTVDWSSDNGGSLTLTGAAFAGASGTVSTAGQRGTFDAMFTATFTDLDAGAFTLTAEIDNLCRTSDTTTCTGEANPTGFIARASTIPLPAALWLMLGALGGLAGAHRVANRRVV